MSSRAAMERMAIMWAFCREGYYPNATDLARVLEVSTKTIHRDLEFMRDRLHLPLTYDGSRHGYFAECAAPCCFCGPAQALTAPFAMERKPLPLKLVAAGQPGRVVLKQILARREQRQAKLKAARREANRRNNRRWSRHDRRNRTFINRYHKP